MRGLLVSRGEFPSQNLTNPKVSWKSKGHKSKGPGAPGQIMEENHPGRNPDGTWKSSVWKGNSSSKPSFSGSYHLISPEPLQNPPSKHPGSKVAKGDTSLTRQLLTGPQFQLLDTSVDANIGAKLVEGATLTVYLCYLVTACLYCPIYLHASNPHLPSIECTWMWHIYIHIYRLAIYMQHLFEYNVAQCKEVKHYSPILLS